MKEKIDFRLSFFDYWRYRKRIRRLLDKHDRVPIVRVERWRIKECVYYGLIDAERIDPDSWERIRRLPRARDSPAWAGAAELVGGEVEECVLFATEEDAWQNSLYDVCYAGTFLRLSEVKSVLESPHKLPVHLEEEMNDVGETHMGGMVVNFILKDGSKFYHTSGSANLSFVSTPEGCSPDDIVDVEYGRGSSFVPAKPSLKGPRYKWCVFNPPIK